MSDLKRKHGATIGKNQESAKKKQKRESGADDKPASEKTKDTEQKLPTRTQSVLSKDQTAFPRGGAGPLSLLEQKQIRAKATRDVAKKLQGGDLFTDKDDAGVEPGDSDLDLDDVDQKQVFAKKKSKTKKTATTTVESDTVPIESISYKKLADSSLLLGKVSKVTSRGLTMSLPNNLTGFVPLTAISKQFNGLIEKVLQKDEEDGMSDSDSEHDVDLKEMFRVGQILRCAVIKVSGGAGGNRETKKKIQLSIEPEKVNLGIQKASFVSGVTVQAAIVSVEDHGAIVDIGLSDGSTAFLPEKSLPAAITLTDLKVGTVLLCCVEYNGSKRKAVQLSTDLKLKVNKSAPSVDAYLPGTLVDVLLTHVTEDGLVGKVAGILDVTADVLHSTSFLDRAALAEKYKIGQKVPGRLLANFATNDDKKLAFSVIESITDADESVENRLSLSSIIDRVQVLSIVHGLGVYVSLPSGAMGFAHISRLSDKNVDTLSETVGPYKIGSEHQARVLEYNAVDGLYILSLEQSVIDRPFLRLEDVKAGDVVKGTIEKLLIGEEGVRGLLVKVVDGITGHVSPLHFSDATLTHPERKFKEDMAVKVRVLSVRPDVRRMDLTLKKSLINSDQPVWSDLDTLQVGDSTVGTLVKVDSMGALVEFYGRLKGRLPVAEMSEAFIKDATDHFKVGQVLTVHILKLDSERQKLILSARDPATITHNDTSNLHPGDLVDGVVFEKNADDAMLRLESSGTIARLTLPQVADGSENKRKSALEKLRVGQKLEGLLILDVKGRQVNLTNKASLRKAASEGKLLKSFDQLVEDMIVTGFVSNITENKVFVRFAQGITGVLNQAQIADEQVELEGFGMKMFQAVSARVIRIDYRGATPRFWLSMKTSSAPQVPDTPAVQPVVTKEIVEPVDGSIQAYTDLSVGKVINVRITSIKETQLNVYIAKDVQGRVDVSEVYDSIDAIQDRKSPLNQFSTKQVIAVKIIGQHDSRSYKFLPLSHRSSKNLVFELSARPSIVSSDATSVLKLEDLKVDQSYMAFVNNVADHSLMVNISPAARGRIRDRDVSDDLSLAANLPRNFPIGSVLMAKVISVDVDKKHLDLSARTGAPSKILTIDSISTGDIVAGRITKTTERNVLIQLAEDLVGAVDLIDLSDDFDLADPTRFGKDEIVRAFVLQVDKPNKRIHLSLRPSKILSSNLEVKDPDLTLQTINVNDICRGFIANVSEKGIFVTLARGLTAFVRVTNLSDDYLKEWRERFHKDQFVQGKILLVDKDSGHVQMSLRKSHIDGTYRPPITFNDLSVGDIIEAKIAKVEIFGVFIVVNNSENVRGLCHRSEIAEKRVQDATKLGFSEGDAVKAKVLKVEPDQRRVNFGMKASYFEDVGDDDDAMEDEMIADGVSDGGAALLNDEEVTGSEEDVEIDESTLDDDESGFSIDLNAIQKTVTNAAEVEEETLPSKGLSVGGFDWFGMPPTIQSTKKRPAPDDDSPETTTKPKKKKRRSSLLVDHTDDIAKTGAQSIDDFESLTRTDPDNAQLWIQYMAFHIDLGDIDAARTIGTRALSSISINNEPSKRALHTALLNIENTFGDDDSVSSALQRACQTLDPEDTHSTLASIYIQSGKLSQADSLFTTMTSKFTQNTKLWLNYATFLFDQLEEPVRARALLPRALQALPPFTHFETTKQFALLEFKTKTGVPEEGRTRFQGLINLYPKRIDLFSVLLDQEMRSGERGGGDVEQIRGVFEQVLQKKDLKPVKIKPFFERWLRFEMEDERGSKTVAEDVKKRAAEWVGEYDRRKGKEKDH